MVPVTHGRWLAATVPTAEPTIVPGEGHLSLEGRLDDGLRRLGDLLRTSA
jgi:hypothetical protein